MLSSMTGNRLVPAVPAFADGVPFSHAYGDVYHTADGGLGQAEHVFLRGNGLPERWRERGNGHFTILETGFGLGLNFLATWRAWRNDPERSHRLHYVSVEKHPFAESGLAQVHALWPELAELSAALRAAWPPLVSGFHRLLLDEGRVSLTLVFGDIADCLPQIEARADAFYLDGFAPGRNPDMWSPEVLTRLKRLAAPDATLATWSIASAVRKALMEAGFVCERTQGYGRKPEMLKARFAPRWPQLPRQAVAERRAIVIGAGIAGSAACERLAARGWNVILIERHDSPAQEASGNLAGIVMPLLSRDDNLVSRLSRSAYLYTLGMWQQLGGIGRGFAGEACGVLQLARDAAHARTQREIVEDFAYPPDFVQWQDAATVAEVTGNPQAQGAWLFPQAGWVTPSSLCAAMLDACGPRLQRRFSRGAARLERSGGQWRVQDAAGAVIAEAPVVIIAAGSSAASFAQTRELPLTAIRGQVTHLPADALPALSAISQVLCGEGYLTRPVQGMCCVGASYDFDSDPALRQASHEENLERLAQLLPQANQNADRAYTGRAYAGRTYAGRVAFRSVSPDRLPLVGALPDAAATITGSRLRDVPRLPGLYGLLGYGSRGLTWAPLAAELLACYLEGEPLPVESELATALDPARFALKAHRRGNNIEAEPSFLPDRHAENS